MSEKTLPLIDPHRHLGGSISVECVWNIIQKRQLYHLASSIDDVRKSMTFDEDEPRGFHRFLDKFKILDEIDWDEELIEFSIKSVCDDLEKEGIDFCWLDFSINKYMRLKWSKIDAIEFIYNCFEKFRPDKVGLVLSLKYESLQNLQKRYAGLIDDPRVTDILMGLDLVGDEEYFDADFYAPIFKEWRNARKMVRAHVGESQTAGNIRDTIIKLHATNIAHGIKCLNDISLTEMALAHNVTFDTAITSNYLTGVWSNPNYHPVLFMLDNNLSATIGSDDPIQCSTTLNAEFDIFNMICSDHEKQKILRTTALANTLKYVNSEIQEKLS